MICNFLTLTASDNILCDTDSWNVIKGSWTFDDNDCSLENTDSGAGNVMWFGSANGLTPDDNFDDESFTMSVTMSIHSGSNAGVLFRAGTVTTTNHGGQQYYVGIVLGSNNRRVFFGTVNNGWNEQHAASVPGLDYDTIYTLSIQALGDSYTIYLDGVAVLSDITRTEYGSGSIGLRTAIAPTTFYSVSYGNGGTVLSMMSNSISQSLGIRDFNLFPFDRDHDFCVQFPF